MTTADVMAALQPIWSTKNETAQRVRRRIGAVMRWAIAQGYRSDNPTGDAVTAALPKRPRQIRHFPALPHGEVGAALACVRVSQAWTGTKLAFDLLVLTAARSEEVRLATWEEFDLAALVWTIPAARMTAGGTCRPSGRIPTMVDGRTSTDGCNQPRAGAGHPQGPQRSEGRATAPLTRRSQRLSTVRFCGAVPTDLPQWHAHAVTGPGVAAPCCR